MIRVLLTLGIAAIVAGGCVFDSDGIGGSSDLAVDRNGSEPSFDLRLDTLDGDTTVDMALDSGDGSVDSDDAGGDTSVDQPQEGPLDTDKDGVPDSNDNCPLVPNTNQNNADNDALGDVCDNCISVANDNQADQDNDSIGDVCDPDRDGDTIPNASDPFPTVANNVLYYEPSVAAAQSDFPGPNWPTSGASLCRTSTEKTLRLRVLNASKLAGNDYVVESAISITAAQTPSSVGLVFRVANQSPLDLYFCVVNQITGGVILGKANSGTQTVLDTSNLTPIGSYRMRVTAKGSQLTCQLLPAGPTLAATDADHPSGPVGFWVYSAQACFGSSLAVVDAP